MQQDSNADAVRMGMVDALPFFIFALVYLSTISKNLSIAHDSPGYLAEIISAPNYHTHHLLYEPVSAAWYWLLRHLGIAGSPISTEISLNSIGGAAITQLVYWLARVRLSLRESENRARPMSRIFTTPWRSRIRLPGLMSR